MVPIDLHRRLCAVARERGLLVHLDGARIFNASVASGVPASEYARDVDSVMFCLSKGMSQAGVIAAAGIVALEGMIDRLAEDHANAKLLARGISGIPGFAVDAERVETNMVFVDHTESGLDSETALARLKAARVLAGSSPPRRIRFVTNRHHDEAIINEAIARIRGAWAT